MKSVLGVALTLLAAGFPATLAAQTIPELVLGGRFDEARAELDARDASPIDRALTEALIAQRRGDTADAIRRLRDIVRARPELVPPRRLLANLLFATEQYEAAEFHYRRLIEDDPANRAEYNRALRAIAARVPFGFTGGLALVPSTNINRGTSNEIFRSDFGDFVIDDESLGTTGVGLAVSAGVFRRFDFGEGRRLQFDARASAIIYDKPEFNQHSFTLSGTYTATSDQTGWSAAPRYTRAYLAGALSYNGYGLTLSRVMPVGERTGLRLTGRAEHRDYITDTFLTGQRYEAEAALSRRIDARTALQGSLAYKVGEVEVGRFSYDGVEVGTRLTRAFENGLRLDVGLSYERRPYRENFTGVSFPRDDSITTLSVSAFSDRWTVFGGAAPTYSCRQTWAVSNIAFYDYDVTECTIGFTRQF